MRTLHGVSSARDLRSMGGSCIIHEGGGDVGSVYNSFTEVQGCFKYSIFIFYALVYGDTGYRQAFRLLSFFNHLSFPYTYKRLFILTGWYVFPVKCWFQLVFFF